MKEAFQKSYFTRLPKARGVKAGAIKLLRNPEGGFMSSPKGNQRLELENVLEQFAHVKEKRDKYD